jgi:gliding motility-associated-like protein
MLDAGNVGSSYLWQDHTTAQIYTVSVQGIYAVGVTSRGCTGSDSIQVSYISAPSVFSLGENKTLCDDQTVMLDASQPNTFYRWSNGAITDTITVNLTNTYVVLDSNACGTASDSIMLTFESCVCRVNIPTGFSPNDDGKNDELGVVTICAVENFQMEVYDRWGMRVFQTTSVSDRWDGTYKGRNQPIGVYIYRLKYTDPFTNKVNNVSGNVTLLR